MKKRLECRKILARQDSSFSEYSRTYYNTNENLAEYITDLKDKDVLTVSSSGNQLINMIGRGAKRVDTFDINRYSPLFQNLRLYSIKYLSRDLALSFLSNINSRLYFKFNMYLPDKEKEFFDYLFTNYDDDYVCSRLFYFSLNNIKNNNYYDPKILDYIKQRLTQVEHEHFSVSLYQLTNYLSTLYDSIYLSNISFYCTNVDKFLNYINYLRYYLNPNGKIYYAYLYEISETNVEEAIKKISPLFSDAFDSNKFSDIISNTELINIRSAYDSEKKDTVLVLR